MQSSGDTLNSQRKNGISLELHSWTQLHNRTPPLGCEDHVRRKCRYLRFWHHSPLDVMTNLMKAYRILLNFWVKKKIIKSNTFSKMCLPSTIACAHCKWAWEISCFSCWVLQNIWCSWLLHSKSRHSENRLFQSPQAWKELLCSKMS